MRTSIEATGFADEGEVGRRRYGANALESRDEIFCESQGVVMLSGKSLETWQVSKNFDG